MALYFRKDLAEFDYYDIANELAAFTFKKEVGHVHEIRDKLGSSLETLKRRGIPVDRLLQSVQEGREFTKSEGSVVNTK